MRTCNWFAGAAALSLLFGVGQARAASTIDPAHPYAYAANLGWLNWLGDTNHGTVIGEYVCSGYIYSANVGWINLGSGSPTNGISYQNLGAADFGVNQDGSGNLRGDAWGANIGWIVFESTGAPKVDLASGRLTGYAWSANCGWISLSNSVAYVQTDSIQRAPLAGNGLPVAWLLTYFGTTNVDANADADGDGMSNAQEYLAGTDPTNAADALKITSVAHSPTSGNTSLQWPGKPTRAYSVQSSTALGANASWTDTVNPGVGADSATFLSGTGHNSEFYRVRAYPPLSP